MKSISLLLLLVLFQALATAKTKKPNFLFIFGDDISAHTLGAYGGQVKTPHLDELVKEGMKFTNAYSNVAMCAPFRQELYSGRSSWRTKTLPNHSKSVKGTKSIPHYLQAAGYMVGLAGKSHVGPANCYPFDMLGDSNKVEDPNPILQEKATRYINQAIKAKKPFCLFVASNDGHGPYTTGDVLQYPVKNIVVPPYHIDTPELRRSMAAHFAEITNLDLLLGNLKAFLKKQQLLENTIIVYCSEQGNGFPFAKWTVFNNGLKSAVVASCPGLVAQGSCDEIMWISDIAPTFCEAAGLQYDPKTFDGKSQWANFSGKNVKVHDYAFGAFSNCNIIDNRDRVFPIRSIRTKQYSLIWSPNSEQLTSNTTLTKALDIYQKKLPINASTKLDPPASWFREEVSHPKKEQLRKQLFKRPEWALYDLEKDPFELHNLADKKEMSATKAELQKALKAWLKKWDDEDPIATEKSLIKAPRQKKKKR